MKNNTPYRMSLFLFFFLVAFSSFLLTSYKPLSGSSILPASTTFRDISSEELHRSYKSKNWKIIDVRTEEEFKMGHLPDAIWLPTSAFSAENFKKLGLEIDDNLLIYCYSGSRSIQPSRILAEYGYKNVYNLQNGILSWRYPIER